MDTSGVDMDAPIEEDTKENDNEDAINKVNELAEQYKKATLDAKHDGDLETSKKFLVVYKQLKQMQESLQLGEQVDLSNLPGLPEKVRIVLESWVNVRALPIATVVLKKVMEIDRKCCKCFQQLYQNKFNNCRRKHW